MIQVLNNQFALTSPSRIIVFSKEIARGIIETHFRVSNLRTGGVKGEDTGIVPEDSEIIRNRDDRQDSDFEGKPRHSTNTIPTVNGNSPRADDGTAIGEVEEDLSGIVPARNVKIVTERSVVCTDRNVVGPFGQAEHQLALDCACRVIVVIKEFARGEIARHFRVRPS